MNTVNAAEVPKYYHNCYACTAEKNFYCNDDSKCYDNKYDKCIGPKLALFYPLQCRDLNKGVGQSFECQ